MIIWISRGYPKYFGFPMDLQISWIHGYPRIFSIREEINGYLWQSMVIYGNPWKSMEIHGYPWISEIYMDIQKLPTFPCNSRWQGSLIQQPNFVR